jgi:hypothetical protein
MNHAFVAPPETQPLRFGSAETNLAELIFARRHDGSETRARLARDCFGRSLPFLVLRSRLVCA